MEKKTDIFLGIIESHKGIIYKITNSYCKDANQRQDLIQEIIIQLWQSFDNYNNKYRLSTWIYRISLNTSISFYRKNKLRKNLRFSESSESTLVASEPYEEDPNLKKLQDFIQQLRELDKALILLHLEGLKQKEIAKIMGITPTNVGTKLTRIKKVLRHKFDNIKSIHHAGRRT